MKIFNIENGKRVVYVQLNDLAHILKDGEVGIPQSVMDKVFNGIFYVADHNRYDFKRFDGEHEVRYFEKLDWIVDYKKVRDHNEEQIIELANQINDKMNEYAKKFNSLPVKNDDKAFEIETRHALLEHKFYSLRDVLWFKQGHLEMSLPIVPDSDKDYTLSSNGDYVAYVGLNPKQLLICRRSKKSFEHNTDKLDSNFVKSALNDLIKSNQDTNQYFNEFEVSYSFTEDGLYYLCTLSIKTPEMEEEVKKEENIEAKEKNVKEKRTIKNKLGAILSLIRKK